MTARIYDDCELVIQSSGERYVVQILNIHAGEASGEFVLPFTQVELSNFYSRIGQAHRATRRADSPDVEAAKRFGDQLFRCVFSGELLSQLRASVDHAHERGHGLRLRLRLKNVPDLGELPWEFLYDSEQDHFLATSTLTPMVRYLDLPQSVSTLRVRAPLRILVVLAGPPNLARLDAEGEWQRLQKSLAPLETSGAIVLERLCDGTLASLRRRARGESFHILHFVGHGGFDQVAGDGVLHFESTTGLSDPIPGQMLGNILRDHDTLRLAVLNACEGARQSNQNPFSGVAQSLCQQRLPAVIAMQFEISDDAAKTFAEEFYGAIADGLPVDAAVSESRKALYSGRFGQEWATPVLYMRSPSGALFDIQRRAKPAAQQQEPAAKAVQQPAPPAQQPPPQQPPPQQQQPAQQQPVPPPPPPPKPAFDIEAERRKLDAERARLEEERRQREQAAADAEARRRNEEERLKGERLRFEQEQAQARIAAEAQRKREEQARKEDQLRREREDQARQQAEAQRRAEQERVHAEEAKRKAEQARQQKERAEREARVSPPPPPPVQPRGFAGDMAQPKKSHRVGKVILWILGIIFLIFVILMIIGLVAESNDRKQRRATHLEDGDKAFAARDFDQAITEYKAAIENHPDLAVAHARLCNAIAFKGENSANLKGDYDAAVSECEKAAQLNPDLAEAHSNLCNALNDQAYSTLDIKADYTRAIGECRKAVHLDSTSAEAYNNLCNVVGTRAEQAIAKPNDHKEALEACKQALRLNPNLAAAHKNTGDLYRDEGKYNEAAAEYRQAVMLDPHYERAQAELGVMFYRSSKFAPAIAELQKAIALQPNDYYPHFWLANVYYFGTKEIDKAIAEFRHTIEFNPSLASAEFYLSEALRGQGNAAEANEHLTRAYALDSNDNGISADYKKYITSGSSLPNNGSTAQADQTRQADLTQKVVTPSAAPPPATEGQVLTGWYTGITRNTTYQKESRAAIFLEQNGRELRGCLLVYPPLGGSGPLTGTVDSSAILLQAKSSDYTITFNGDVAGGKMVGSYVVHWPKLQSEFGNMSLTKTSTTILSTINVNHCPSDAEKRAWAGM